ncbi:MAG: ABC transporter ATP-binding protein [Pseudomonadota bacterium]
MHDAVYELRGVSRVYGRGDRIVPAVRDVDLSVARGELLAVVGPSGSGKTTLLQLLGGLDRPSSGAVRFEGRDLAGLGDGELTGLRREALGFVFQQFNLIPTLTAAQNVEAALAPTGRPRAERRARVEEVLEAVGLAPRSHHLPSRLSGGEQQRVAIARALANDPRVLLADEPTGNLDSATGAEIVGVLRSLAEEDGRTVVIVTHDATVAGQAGRVARMQDGRLLAPEAAVVT